MKTTEPADGEFWLPDAPGEKVSGTLFLAEETGPRLQLTRILTNSDSEPNPIPVIFGSTFGLDQVTLGDCFRSEDLDAPFLGIAKHTLLPSLVLSGAHLPSPSHTEVLRATARFTYLDQWVTRPLVDWTGPDMSENAAFNLAVEVKGAPLETASTEHFALGFTRRISMRSSSSRVEVGFETSAHWDLARAVTLDEFILRFLFPFRDLFSLASGGSVELLELDVVPASPLPTPPPGVAPVRGVGVFILEMRHPRQADPTKRVAFLFWLSDLAPRLSPALVDWYRLYADHEQFLMNFFSVAYRKGLYPEVRFLSLIQAVEAYCRGMQPTDTALPLEEHAELCRSVLQTFPNYADWLRGKLQGNEPSLRKRLKSLLRRSPVQVSIQGSTADEFLARVVDVRNALSHGLQAELRQPLRPFEISDLADALVILVEGLCLEKLGLDRPNIAERLSHTTHNRGSRVLVEETRDAGATG